MLPGYDETLDRAAVNRRHPHLSAPSGLSAGYPAAPQPPPARQSRATAAAAESVVLKKLAPTAPGARRFARRYGAALVGVRYREDPANSRRLTTVEQIVEERPMPSGELWVRISYGESDLRTRVKDAGGQWDATRKLWRVSRAVVRTLKLAGRVVAEDA
jgi:hypothetical protein